MSTNIVFSLSLYFCFLLSPVLGANQPCSLTPTDLACELRIEPLGIDILNPEFSYQLKPSNRISRGLKQLAYQIIVSSSLELLENNISDLWNSQKIISDHTTFITYQGKPLKSSCRYWWKVRVWDKEDHASDWSTPSVWTMGILNDTDWKASWITADGAEKYAIKYSSARQDFNLERDFIDYRKAAKPSLNDPNYSSMLIRKEFIINTKLKSAIIHICGLGHYELTINGKKAGDYLLAPGWTDYRYTALYDTYNLTPLLKEGNNAIGILLSNGMYNIQFDSIRFVKFLNSYGPLKAKAQLHLEYSDGSTEEIGTDNTWHVAPGPITYMNEYGGEDFDSRLIEKGWNSPTFKNSNRWSNAVVLPDSGIHLKGLSCAAPPIKTIDSLAPVKRTEIKPNVWIYDLGQNASIMPKLIVKGPVGSIVRITPAELLYPDGSLDRRSATQHAHGPAWWQYTLNEEETQVYFPKFFYQGGRYLQVELIPEGNEHKFPEIISLTGMVIHSSASPTGSFSCSNPLFNQIYSLVRWAQRSNLMSTLTDCPTREKMAWLEQYHLNGPSLRYNFDLLTLFRKSMSDMSDSQYQNGFVPNIAPELFFAGSGIFSDSSNHALFAGSPISNGIHNSPEWGSSFIIVPWQQYLFSGDVSLIKRYYDKMKKYIGFLDSWAVDHILYFGLGDWYDIGPKDPWGSQLTPIEFTATAIYYYDYEIMTKMARIINNEGDAILFENKAREIKKAFNAKFFNNKTKIYSTGSNTAMAIPLALGIAESNDRKAIASILVSDIQKNGNSFTSGDVGYRYLLKALAMEGFSDLIFEMNNQSDKPGYGYQIKMGATALTEKWNADGREMGSQNHFMLGQINEWFFHDLAGIGFNENGEEAGFKYIIIKPTPVKNLQWVKCSYKTLNGLISTEWHQKNSIFSLDIFIPANTKAKVYIPAKKESDVKEGNQQAAKANGVKFIGYNGNNAIYEVGSGVYHFTTKD